VFLAQGTLRPDLIESASRLASSNADIIKTHHNDSKLIRELRDKGHVIEPLQEFHKDEVCDKLKFNQCILINRFYMFVLGQKVRNGFRIE